jgi:hypothetical protein
MSHLCTCFYLLLLLSSQQNCLQYIYSQPSIPQRHLTHLTMDAAVKNIIKNVSRVRKKTFHLKFIIKASWQLKRGYPAKVADSTKNPEKFIRSPNQSIRTLPKKMSMPKYRIWSQWPKKAIFNRSSQFCDEFFVTLFVRVLYNFYP